MKRRIVFLFVSFVLTFSTARAQLGHLFPSDQFSSGLINKLCQDKYGFIWIGTEYGLNKFDGYRFTTYLHHDDDSTSLVNNAVSSMFCDKEGRLWVGTSKGLDCYDYATDKFVHYDFGNDYKPRVSVLDQWQDGTIVVGTAGYGLYRVKGEGKLEVVADGYTAAEENNYFSRLFRDSKGRIWKSGYHGTLTMRTPAGKVTVMTSPAGDLEQMIEREGEVLFFCIHGICKYDGERLVPAGIEMPSVSGGELILRCAFKNIQGDIYVGTRGNGLLRLARGSTRLEQVECAAKDVDLNTAKVWDVMEDRNGNLWVGCQSKGLLLLRHTPPQFHAWDFAGQGFNLGTTVSSVCEGDGGMIWVAEQGNGIYGFDRQGRVVSHPACPPNPEVIFRDRDRSYWVGTDKGLYSYDPVSGHSEQKVTFDCNKFNYLTSDGNGNIYVSTFSRGFCIYNTVTGQLRNFNSQQRDSVRGWLCNDWVLAIMPDTQGRIWVATSCGVSCYDPKADSFRSLGWHQLLNNVMCYSLCETATGDILIGTDQGLYVYRQGETEAEPFHDGDCLKDKVVGYIVEASNGDVWCSTPMGLWQFDKDKDRFIGHISGDGLNSKEYINCVGLHTGDDVIYFATNDGITMFRAGDVEDGNTELPDVQLTACFLAGHPVSVDTESNGTQVVKVPLMETDRLRVSYLENAVQLEFSLMDFNKPANIIYEYRIGGGEWTQNPEGQNAILLSHLQPGTYIIEVRALLAGIYSKTKTITIEVTPPWYRTTLAYIIYLLALIGLIGFLAWSYRRHTNQQLDEEKMKFLINATHDIRSPLTIILSALKKLEKSAAVDTIERNSQRILTLVNQILDVRKIDKQQMHLHCQSTDMVQFVSGVCKMFEFNAQERNISFVFQHDGIDKLEAWIDRTQFDKVVSNLLSNAFKYSYDGGEVVVKLSVPSESSFSLQVQDNGAGLDSDNLKHIFDRFYQGNNSQHLHIDGTGIGLNLCKMIVDMHHGVIEASNRTDVRGSLFTVTLPLGNSHLKEEEMVKGGGIAASSSSSNASNQSSSASSGTSSRHRVLIVDDDQEIGQYISQELGRYYKFGICSNGKEAMKELLQNEYDVVVSDVMMPEMDGFTLLRLIKTNLNLSHLPVIMLTSKADVANRLEGLERGADAFLAKPFDMEELHMIINNLIHSRLHLKGKYSGAQQQADKLEALEVKGNDEQLMERIMKVLNKNIGDSDFNVEMLCQEVGISRTQLHRKMKEMTGLSTSEFIRNIRLEQAARLLKEQKVNVTQVAYIVGFSNLAHFSTVFRKHFGVSPSEYVERK